MKFVLLIYQGTAPLPGSDRWQALSAVTVQVRDGKPQVKSGTYLTEGVGGYFVFEAESMEAAVALAARIPAARLGGAVEIRPAEQYW